MILTKHCTPQNRQRMLAGHFKIGTHKEYSSGAGTGLLSDTSEGQGSVRVVGDITNWSGEANGNIFHNITSIGAKYGFVASQTANCNVFCVSSGNYKADRHREILSGTLDYPSNPESSAFLTFDSDRLRVALQAASDELYPAKTRWLMRPVSYGSRDLDFQANEKFSISGSKRLIRIAFTKPQRFSLEEEFRFVMSPSDAIQHANGFLTVNLSPSVQEKFRESVESAGSDAPRY